MKLALQSIALARKKKRKSGKESVAFQESAIRREKPGLGRDGLVREKGEDEEKEVRTKLRASG